MSALGRALLAVLAAAALAPAAAHAKKIDCGSLTVGGDRLPVKVVSGSVTCSTARRAMRRFLPRTGHGVQSFRLARRRWFCADAHGRELARGGVAHCTTGRVRVVATQPAPAPPTSSPPAVGTTRDNPIPVGTSAAVGDWQIVVQSVTPDGWPMIHANDEYTSPPPAGSQDFIAAIQATYTGPGSGRVGDRLSAVGPSAVGYDAWDCGTVPNELPFSTEVFHGGTISGNVCWQVAAGDADALVMYSDPDFDSARRVYFSLAPAA